MDDKLSLNEKESAFDPMKKWRDKSKKRRELLAQQFGLSSTERLKQVFAQSEDITVDASNVSSEFLVDTFVPAAKKKKDDDILDTSKGIAWVAPNIVDEELEKEEVYSDSSTFLKGTQSENPHNDYCQHFVDTGRRPQNFIHDAGLDKRFEVEYPKLRELIRLKDELISETNHPPMYFQADLESFDLRDLNFLFDTIYIEPPLEEYQRTLGVVNKKHWSWDMIESLEIDKISDHRGFLYMWCGSSDGLDAGRRCLKRWGFRRCEDICWIKTNKGNPGHNKNLEPKAIFQRTKEHLLMGIKGTVRRSIDGDFIHANVDIDLIIDEEKEYGCDERPIEIFHMMEHFCLGRRRLHIFGRDSMIRPGWLSIGPDLTSSNYDSDLYASHFGENSAGILTKCPDDIERLRPKSPPPRIMGENGEMRGGGRGFRGNRGMNRGNSNRGNSGPNQRGGFGNRGNHQMFFQ